MHDYNKASINTYAVSAPLSEGNQAHGMVRDGQIVRWTLQGMSTVGTTIRLCVTNGALTLYVSYLPAPSEVLNSKQSTIATTSKLAVDCTTFFTGSLNTVQRKRRQASQNHTTTIYMSVVGGDNDTVYSLNSERGNVSFGKETKPEFVHALPYVLTTSSAAYTQMSMNVDSSRILVTYRQAATILMAVTIVNATKASVVMDLNAQVGIIIHATELLHRMTYSSHRSLHAHNHN